MQVRYQAAPRPEEHIIPKNHRTAKYKYVRPLHGAIDMIYQSAPGIGPHNARVLSSELADMKQFKNEKNYLILRD